MNRLDSVFQQFLRERIYRVLQQLGAGDERLLPLTA